MPCQTSWESFFTRKWERERLLLNSHDLKLKAVEFLMSLMIEKIQRWRVPEYGCVNEWLNATVLPSVTVDEVKRAGWSVCKVKAFLRYNCKLLVVKQ